jgi:hypothetical protein
VLLQETCAVAWLVGEEAPGRADVRQAKDVDAARERLAISS